MLLHRKRANSVTLSWSRRASLSYGVSIARTCRPLLLEGCQLHAAVDVEPSVKKSVFLALRPSWKPLRLTQGRRSRYRRCRDCGTNVDAAHYIFIALKPTRMCTRGISFMNIILWFSTYTCRAMRVSLRMRRRLDY